MISTYTTKYFYYSNKKNEIRTKKCVLNFCFSVLPLKEEVFLLFISNLTIISQNELPWVEDIPGANKLVTGNNFYTIKIFYLDLISSSDQLRSLYPV